MTVEIHLLLNKRETLSKAIGKHKEMMHYASMSDNFYFTNGRRRRDELDLQEMIVNLKNMDSYIERLKKCTTHTQVSEK